MRLSLRLSVVRPCTLVAAAITVAVCPLAGQDLPRPGGGAFRTSTGFGLLVPVTAVTEQTLFPTGRLPGGRGTLSFQLTPRLGWHIGGVRLAPTDAALWAGVMGFRLNLFTGRIRIAPFVEGGYGFYDAVVDSGGIDFTLPDGTNGYRPFRRPIQGTTWVAGGGGKLELILGPGITFEFTGGYWHAPYGTTTISQPFVGGGLRLAFRDEVWYWRRSGRDRIAPTLRTLAPVVDSDGRVPVGRGPLRLLASDLSGIRSIEVNGRELTLVRPPAEERPERGEAWVAMVTGAELGLRPGENVVQVVTRDGAGNESSEQLTLLGPPPDRTAPVVVITEPDPAAQLDQPLVRVVGVAADESDLAWITINGVLASVGPADASALAALGTEPPGPGIVFEAEIEVAAGLNLVEILATDSEGNVAQATHEILRPDRTAPRIAIASPVEGAEVGASRVPVSGWVIDDGQVFAVTVNGIPARIVASEDSVALEAGIATAVPTTQPGERAVWFSADVRLSPGSNVLRVAARDASGNESESERFVERQAVAAAAAVPIIRIEEPRGWAGTGTRGIQVVPRSSIEVRGTARDPLGAGIREVLVDGGQATLQHDPGGTTRFVAWVPIESQSGITVEAFTADGRFATERYGVLVAGDPADASDWSTEFQGQRYAVVVGISDYQDPTIPDLEYADDDAQSIYDFLRSDAAGGGGLPEENIRLLIDGDATFGSLRSALFTFLERATDQDIVYIYIAGHGAPNPRRQDELYILTNDTDAADIPGTAFPMSDVQAAVQRLYAHHTVLLTDACHSGGIGVGGATQRAVGGAAMNQINQAFLMDLSATQRGLAVLTASEARQLSAEGPQWGGGHGVFTHYLLEGLHGAADEDDNQIVDWGELTEYVREMVSRETQNAQIPSIGSQTHDRFLPMSIVLDPPGR